MDVPNFPTGILDDKPYSSMLKTLCSICNRAILTQPKINRALPPEKLYSAAKEVIADIKIIPDVSQAIKHAIKTTPKKRCNLHCRLTLPGRRSN